MRISEIGTITCPVARAVNLVGDPWTLMILRELFLGSRRFDDLQKYLRLSPRLLSTRMRGLTAAGIVNRAKYQDRPTRYEYRFTEKGRDLWPVIMALRAWGDRWGDWPDGSPTSLVHKSCGAAATIELVCSECGEPIGPGNVTVEQSPAARAERVALAAKVG